MKKIALGILPLTLAGSLLFAGCASQHAEPVYVYNGPAARETTQTVVVYQEPPPAQTDIETAPPGPTEVWVQSYWNNTHGKWIWMAGHWETRPRANAVWISGHWDKDTESNDWTWTPGHWA